MLIVRRREAVELDLRTQHPAQVARKAVGWRKVHRTDKISVCLTQRLELPQRNPLKSGIQNENQPDGSNGEKEHECDDDTNPKAFAHGWILYAAAAQKRQGLFR